MNNPITVIKCQQCGLVNRTDTNDCYLGILFFVIPALAPPDSKDFSATVNKLTESSAKPLNQLPTPKPSFQSSNKKKIKRCKRI